VDWKYMEEFMFIRKMVELMCGNMVILEEKWQDIFKIAYFFDFNFIQTVSTYSFWSKLTSFIARIRLKMVWIKISVEVL
jgi:hypothetical protein